MPPDIDHIAELLEREIPGVQITQLQVTHPGADDAGLWLIKVPGRTKKVQMESSSGSCPFLIESDFGSDRHYGRSVYEVVGTVMKLFAEAGMSSKELLESLHQKPGLFWGDSDVPFTSLIAFVSGFYMGDGTELVPSEFHRFVAEHFGEAWPSSKGWMSFIREHTSSEREAFQVFFQLRDEYGQKH